MEIDCTRNVRNHLGAGCNDAVSLTTDTPPPNTESTPARLRIGDIEVANRVFLAPMSGITDAPFRRLTARLGAGLVVSEMTASDDLARGRPMSVLRCEARGIGPHVVQL